MSFSSSQASLPVEGGCVCQHIRYKLLTAPLITQCCHCTWCQRETGTAFALNAMIEADRVVSLTDNKPFLVSNPTHSGQGQTVARCPKCYVAVWSDYGSGDLARWVKVGTLDHPDLCPPDVQIYTEHIQSWVKLPLNAAGIPVFEQNYRKEDVWSKESIKRLEALGQSMEGNS